MAVRVAGVLVCAIAAALLTAPWWWPALQPTDYLLVELLGVMFAGAGLQAAIPADRAHGLRALGFCAWLGAMGLFCLSIAGAGMIPEDYARHHLVGSMSGLVADVPMWARFACGALAFLLLGIALHVVICVLRDAVVARRR